MIARREVLLAGGANGLLVAHPSSRGQPVATLRRVGLLWTASEVASGDLRVAFMQGMQGLGWLEGKNVEYRFAYADGDVTHLDALVRELIAQKVEVIFTSPTATRAAQGATKTIPIVMAGAANAVGNGYVVSVAKPGGNVTGISNESEQVVGKLIGVLHEVTPGARCLAILVNENNPPHAVLWAAAQSACAALGLVALRVTANAVAQLGAAVAEIVRQQAQAVVVLADGMFFCRAREAAGIAAVHPSAGSLLAARARGRRRVAQLRIQPCRLLPLRGEIRGQDIEGRQTGGPARRSGNQVRAVDQSQDREVARHHDSAGGAAARR